MDPTSPPGQNNQGSIDPLLFLLDDRPSIQVIFPIAPLSYMESVIFSHINSLCFLISYNLLLLLSQRCHQ